MFIVSPVKGQRSGSECLQWIVVSLTSNAVAVGRRYCQTRLVEPRPESINSGDCFVLVTTHYIWLWIGEFSNIIERTKVA